MHLEGLDAAGGRHVRAAAEVDEIAVAIEADLGAGLGEALVTKWDFMKSPSRLEFGQSLFARLEFADELLVARDDFGHLRFDGGEVFGREGLFAIEVVEEAGVGGGAVAELGLREELEHGRGHDVRGGVAHDLERFGVFFRDQFEARVCGERRARSTRRGAAASSAAYIAASDSALIGRWRTVCVRWRVDAV